MMFIIKNDIHIFNYFSQLKTSKVSILLSYGMACPNVYIPVEVLFNNPRGLSIQMLPKLMLVNKEWNTYMKTISNEIIKTSFSKFEYIIGNKLNENNTHFRIGSFYRLLEAIHSFIQNPSEEKLRYFPYNLAIFQENISDIHKIQNTFDMLLRINNYAFSDNSQMNEESISLISILRMFNIVYTYKYICRVFQSKETYYTQNMKLKNTVLLQGNNLIEQINNIISKYPDYKGPCNQVQRIIRYTCRCVKQN